MLFSLNVIEDGFEISHLTVVRYVTLISCVEPARSCVPCGQLNASEYGGPTQFWYAAYPVTGDVVPCETTI